ncbi:plasma kallikrein [Xenopus tropicalis]|uniref:Plasma kallikrein n=1 Tax=Xenopus tropicalis TaxID=8364 RepID=A0A8J1IWT3_XENTR|nr:plasma kallikrein [Xenopus tropicalis]
MAIQSFAKNVNDVLVYAALGAYNLTERKQFYIPVSRTIIHDRYIYPVYYYNIALLELSTDSNQLPFILQESEVQLISLERCRDLYREAYTNILIADTMTCAMDIHENTGISTGDLGGPLVCQKGGQWFLVGVVSLEVILELTLPVSYTSVPAYMDWINKHVFPPNGGSGLIGSMPGVALEVQSLSAFILSLRSLFWVSLQNPMFILMLSTVIWVGC